MVFNPPIRMVNLGMVVPNYLYQQDTGLGPLPYSTPTEEHPGL